MPYNGTATFKHQESGVMAVYVHGIAAGFVNQTGTAPNFSYSTTPAGGATGVSGLTSRKAAVESLLARWWDEGGALTYTPVYLTEYKSVKGDPKEVNVYHGGAYIGAVKWDTSAWYCYSVDHLTPNTTKTTLGLGVDHLIKVWYEDLAP